MCSSGETVIKEILGGVQNWDPETLSLCYGKHPEGPHYATEKDLKAANHIIFTVESIICLIIIIVHYFTPTLEISGALFYGMMFPEKNVYLFSIFNT